MDKQQAQQLVDAARSLISAHRLVADKGEYLTTIIEQIGSHTVVSTEFVLPELWYVENCKEATEWATERWGKMVPFEFKDEVCIASDSSLSPQSGHVSRLDWLSERTKITRDQFIQHVWKPWKAGQEKPRYWKDIRTGEINRIGEHCMPESEFVIIATESEYLAQEAAKTQRPDTDISNLTDPPKFDPETADKTKMYFAVHPEFGEGIIHFSCKNWFFYNPKAYRGPKAEECTHIDHEPIQRRN